MNEPDPLEMQGHIDAMRLAIGLLIANLPIEARTRHAAQLRKDAGEWQTERVPQMAHPRYMQAFEALIRELS